MFVGLSVRPSVRVHQRGSHEKLSFKFDVGNVYESVERIQIWLKSREKISCIWHEDLHRFFVSGDINSSWNIFVQRPTILYCIQWRITQQYTQRIAAVSLQQWLPEHAAMLPDMYIACLVSCCVGQVATYMNESYAKEYAKMCFNFFTKCIFSVSDWVHVSKTLGIRGGSTYTYMWH